MMNEGQFKKAKPHEGTNLKGSISNTTSNGRFSWTAEQFLAMKIVDKETRPKSQDRK
jgi:hypothetical protein